MGAHYGKGPTLLCQRNGVTKRTARHAQGRERPLTRGELAPALTKDATLSPSDARRRRPVVAQARISHVRLRHVPYGAGLAQVHPTHLSLRGSTDRPAGAAHRVHLARAFARLHGELPAATTRYA